MSTLNLPSIIARLHGAGNYGKGRPTMRQQVIPNGYKVYKLPEIARHMGVGDRGWVSLRTNDSLWKQPIYLDQVLRQPPDKNFSTLRSTYIPRHRQKRRPKLLPKLDSKPVLNLETSAPYVQGQNVENFFDSDSSDSYSYRPGSAADEDAVWARNALNGSTHREIVRAYDRFNINALEEIAARVEKGGTTKLHKQKEVSFATEIPLPPITKKDKKSGFSEENTDLNAVLTDGSRNEQPKTKVTEISFEGVGDYTKRVSVRKANQRVSESTHAIEQTQTAFPVEDQKTKSNQQSTFSRILHPASPKTKAGKKLLSSLLGRTNPRNNEKEKQVLQKRNLPPLNKNGVVLFSEEYLRIADSNDMGSKIFHHKNHNTESNKKYGVGILFDKLPAEIVGHHFQQTYEHLWKYLVNNGKNNAVNPYFPTKEELQKKNPGSIYIPTGRPEEALHVEKVDQRAKFSDSSDGKIVRLKYNHRDSEENQDNSRNKNTSPWDLDEELKTPPPPHDANNAAPSLRPRDMVACYESTNYPSGLADGIRKLSITLPPLQTKVPPCTPISSHRPNGTSDEIACQKDCSHCYTNETEEVLSNPSQPKVISEPQSFPTNVKVLGFQSTKNNSVKPKTRRQKQHKSSKGPIPVQSTKQQAVIAETTAIMGRKNSRVYSHGQYHVKVEETTVRRRHLKLPKDMSNMFTKPYTFSYLTGVQPPCNLSSKLYSGKVANLTPLNSLKTTGQESNLVSEIRSNPAADNLEVANPTTLNSLKTTGQESTLTLEIRSNKIPATKDASTQFVADEMDTVTIDQCTPDAVTVQELNKTSIVETELEAVSHPASLAVISPVLSDPHQYKMRVSPVPPKLLDDSKKRTDEVKVLRFRPLSEGAKADEIGNYRDKVKTYDASKYFLPGAN